MYGLSVKKMQKKEQENLLLLFSLYQLKTGRKPCFSHFILRQ